MQGQNNFFAREQELIYVVCNIQVSPADAANLLGQIEVNLCQSATAVCSLISYVEWRGAKLPGLPMSYCCDGTAIWTTVVSGRRSGNSDLWWRLQCIVSTAAVGVLINSHPPYVSLRGFFSTLMVFIFFSLRFLPGCILKRLNKIVDIETQYH